MSSIVSITLESEYENLRGKVFVRAARDGFSRPDCEDILHDIVVEILENQLVPEEYTTTVLKVLGRWKRERSRRMTRGV